MIVLASAHFCDSNTNGEIMFANGNAGRICSFNVTRTAAFNVQLDDLS